MKIEYKVFRVIIFSLLSFPFLFFAYLLMKNEYYEWFVYGNIVNSQIIEIDYRDGDMDGTTTEIVIKSIHNSNTYTSVVNLDTNFLDQQSLENFSEHVKVNDIIKIKIINESIEENVKSDVRIIKFIPENTAKILSWKNISLYEGHMNFGEWITILVLSFLGLLCWYGVFKALKVKTTYG